MTERTDKTVFFKSLGTDTDTFLASGVVSTPEELFDYINDHNAVLGYVQDSAQNNGYPVFGIYTAPVAETPVVSLLQFQRQSL